MKGELLGFPQTRQILVMLQRGPALVAEEVIDELERFGDSADIAYLPGGKHEYTLPIFHDFMFPRLPAEVMLNMDTERIRLERAFIDITDNLKVTVRAGYSASRNQWLVDYDSIGLV